MDDEDCEVGEVRRAFEQGRFDGDRKESGKPSGGPGGLVMK
jgi:hypothetical protein